MAKQIVFAYIRNYLCLKDVSFNFMPDVRINYDKNTKILLIEKIPFPKDIFPYQISSISAIVGMNGSGKTSSLRWLMERCLGGYATQDLGGIVAIREKIGRWDGKDSALKEDIEVIRVYHDVDILGCLNHSDIEFDPIDTRGKIGNGINMSINIPMVFASDCFDILRDDSPTDYEWMGEHNISTNYLLVHDLKSYANYDTLHTVRTFSDHIYAYNVQNSLRISLLILDPLFRGMLNAEGVTDGRVDIKLPTFIIFTPNNSAERNVRRRFEELQSAKGRFEEEGRSIEYQKIKEAHSYFQNVLSLSNVRCPEINPGESEEKELKLNQFLRTSLIGFFYNLFNLNSEYFNHKMKEEVLTQVLRDFKLTTKPSIKWVEHILDSEIFSLLSKEFAGNKYLDSFILRCKNFFYGLEISLKFLAKEVEWEGNTPFLSVDIVKKRMNIKNELVRLMKHESFLTERFFDLRYSHDLMHDSRLSSGELNLLNLFSRIRNAWVKDADPTSNERMPSLLILDEVEVGYHPEWQRRFISRLVHFMAALATPDKPVQVIYTTHSPITLSDMPKQCVNFLRLAYEDKETSGKTIGEWSNRRQTFGENIFSLYRDSFFLDGPPMGCFAQNHIAAWESRLLDGNLSAEDVNNLKDKVAIIGDDRVKSYLSRLLEKQTENDIDLQIERLSKEIERLQEIKAENNKDRRNE